MKKIFQHRLIHFVLIGLAIFGLDRFVAKFFEKSDRGAIKISAEQIESLRSDFLKQVGHQPSQVQLNALVRDVVDEEILVREARRLLLDKGDESVRLRLLSKMRALGEGERYSSDEELFRKAYELKLDEDTVIRRHLVHKMQILLARSVHSETLTDAEVKKYIEQNLQQYKVMPKVTFTQVFIGSQSSKKAQSLLNRLRTSSAAPEMVEALSDPFPLGLHFDAVTEPLLERRFGKEFSKEVLAAPRGEWIGPLESPFGIHLIRVEEVSLKENPSLEALRPLVSRSIAKERAAIQVEENMDRLRKLYSTEIDWNIKRASNASL